MRIADDSLGAAIGQMIASDLQSLWFDRSRLRFWMTTAVNIDGFDTYLFAVSQFFHAGRIAILYYDAPEADLRASLRFVRALIDAVRIKPSLQLLR